MPTGAVAAARASATAPSPRVAPSGLRSRRSQWGSSTSTFSLSLGRHYPGPTMPSQFSTIGFSIAYGEDLAALASHVADKAERISTPPGDYLKWARPSGEQLWLQISPEGDAMGLSAHFAGKSSIRVAIEARVARPSHTPLEGTFLA